jgi:hypothetical protein
MKTSLKLLVLATCFGVSLSSLALADKGSASYRIEVEGGQAPADNLEDMRNKVAVSVFEGKKVIRTISITGMGKTERELVNPRLTNCNGQTCLLSGNYTEKFVYRKGMRAPFSLECQSPTGKKFVISPGRDIYSALSANVTCKGNGKTFYYIEVIHATDGSVSGVRESSFSYQVQAPREKS